MVTKTTNELVNNLKDQLEEHIEARIQETQDKAYEKFSRFIFMDHSVPDYETREELETYLRRVVKLK